MEWSDGYHFEMRYTDAILERWGAWREKYILDEHGLPTINWIVRLMDGRVDSVAGHKILSRDMPKPVWDCHYQVIRLEPIQREAVEAWYIYRMKPEGGVWDQKEKAERLGLPFDTFRRRVQRAKRRIRKSFFGGET